MTVAERHNPVAGICKGIAVVPADICVAAADSARCHVGDTFENTTDGHAVAIGRVDVIRATITSGPVQIVPSGAAADAIAIHRHVARRLCVPARGALCVAATLIPAGAFYAESAAVGAGRHRAITGFLLRS